MTATALTRPALVTRDVIAAQLERLAHWYHLGEFDRDATWRAVDALTSLPEADATHWFEELVAAVAWRSKVTKPGYEYASHQPTVWGPEVLEQAARAVVAGAIEALVGGAH